MFRNFKKNKILTKVAEMETWHMSSIVILNYNGRHLLEKYVPQVIAAAQHYNGSTEIILMDNNSNDGSVEFARSHFPQLRIILNNKNEFFSAANNLATLNAKYENIILLNNDIYPEINFIKLIIDKLNSDDSIFAVCPEIQNYYQNGNETLNRGWLHRGQFIIHWYGLDEKFKGLDKSVQILYACGGCMAFRKKDFIELGGFDAELFKPYYVEDIDLSYRARKSGKKIIFEPLSKVIHYSCSSTTPDLKKRGINKEYLQTKNMFIFFWKNITDIDLLIIHILWLPCFIFKWLISVKLNKILAFVSALFYIPRILKARKLLKNSFIKLTDKQIINEKYTDNPTLL